MRLIPGFLVVWLWIAACENKQQTFRSTDDLHDVLTPADSVQWMNIVSRVDSLGTSGDLKGELAGLDEAIVFCRSNNYPFYLFQVFNIYSQRLHRFGEYDKGSQYLDSAAAVIEEYKIPELKAQLNLAYASAPKHVRSDSSLYYFKLALADTANLIDVYKKVLYANLSRTYITKAYFKEAKFYAEKALAMTEVEVAANRLQNEIHFYQYIHMCEMGLKDTAAAFNVLNKAYRIMMDSLNGKGDETIYRSMSKYYLDKRNYDSALFYMDGYQTRIADTRTEKMQVIPLILKAEIYAQAGNFDKANEMLSIAERQGDPSEEVIGETRLPYFETKYLISKNNGNPAAALAALERVRTMETDQHNDEKSTQLAALEETLTQARAEKTIADKEQKINEQKLYTSIVSVAALLIGVIGFLLYRNQRRKKLLETQRLKTLEQQTIIEKTALKMNAENEERKRISKEIHDDIGPALTTLSMAANMIETPASNEKNLLALSMIKESTKAIGNQINEIIWSLNSNNDNLQSLAAHIRKFAGNFLSSAGIELSFQSSLHEDHQVLEGYKRRNIYHSVKEVLNNAVKYSKATHIDIFMEKSGNNFKLSVKDNGVGLPDQIVYGNGLHNMQENIKKLKGEIIWQNKEGLLVEMAIPLGES